MGIMANEGEISVERDLRLPQLRSALRGHLPLDASPVGRDQQVQPVGADRPAGRQPGQRAPALVDEHRPPAGVALDDADRRHPGQRLERRLARGPDVPGGFRPGAPHSARGPRAGWSSPHAAFPP